MTTKHVLLFVGGVALGYFLSMQMSKRQMAAPTMAAVDPKQAECEAKLAEALKTVKTADVEGFKSQFMADCMSSSTETIANQ